MCICMLGGVGRARTTKSCSNARAFLRSRATFVASSRRRAFSTARRSEACSRFLLCETELAVQQWLHAQCVTIVPGRRAARSLSRRRPQPQPHHVLYFEGSSTHCFFGRASSPLPFLCPFLFLKAIYLPATGRTVWGVGSQETAAPWWWWWWNRYICGGGGGKSCGK